MYSIESHINKFDIQKLNYKQSIEARNKSGGHD